MFKEFNKKRETTETSAVRMCEYHQTHEIPDGKVFKVSDIVLIDGQFGTSALFTVKDEAGEVKMWAPKHISKVCEIMLANPKCVRAIIDGLCGITFREYIDRKGDRHVTIDFVDISPDDPDNLPFN